MLKCLLHKLSIIDDIFGTISYPQERMTESLMPLRGFSNRSQPNVGTIRKSHNQAVCGISSFCGLILFLLSALADLHKNLPNDLCI